MTPQLIRRTTLTVALAVDPFRDDFSLQLPRPSHTISFVSQTVPGALQSIWGKLGSCPLFGLLFHWAATTAINANTDNNSSLFILLLTLSLCHVWTTRRFAVKWVLWNFSFHLKSVETFVDVSLSKGFRAMFRFYVSRLAFKCFNSFTAYQSWAKIIRLKCHSTVTTDNKSDSISSSFNVDNTSHRCLRFWASRFRSENFCLRMSYKAGES